MSIKVIELPPASLQKSPNNYWYLSEQVLIFFQFVQSEFLRCFWYLKCNGEGCQEGMFLIQSFSSTLALRKLSTFLLSLVFGDMLMA